MPEEKGIQIIETIASGGTAVLYKAVQTSLERAVAVKKLHPHLTSDPNFTRRFVLEAKAAASLDHENIVHVIDFGIEGDSYQIVMEYVDGESLKRIMEKWSPMPVDFALAIVHQICLGLEHAHTKGIVHRDIKPGNVMLTQYGRVKITDFGLAKLTQSKTQETAADSILGTPLYMSPEQAFGESVDYRSDLFSLGTMLYEMLTGKQPFASENYMGVIQNIIHKSVPSPKRFNCNIPQPVESILSRSLSKNREARFQSAWEFRIAIEDYLDASKLKKVQENLKTLLISNGSTIAMHAWTAGTEMTNRPKRRFIAVGTFAAAVVSAAIIAFVPGIRIKVKNIMGHFQSQQTGEVSSMDSSLGENIPFGAGVEIGNADPGDKQPTFSTASGDSSGALSFAGQLPAESLSTLGENAARPEDSNHEDAGLTEPSPGKVGEVVTASNPEGSTSGSGSPQAAGRISNSQNTIEDAKTGSNIVEENSPPQSTIKKGLFSITALPSSEIYIDGKYIGDTPPSITIELESGPHQIECRNPQYESYKEVLKIVTGELSRRNITLKKPQGQISLAVTEGAELYIDGKFVGITPIREPITVDAGRHQLSLRKIGFHSWNSEITIQGRKVLPLKITLSPRY